MSKSKTIHSADSGRFVTKKFAAENPKEVVEITNRETEKDLKTSQLKFVREQLETKGFITRNECLRKFISRLSALIFALRESGMDITGERIPYGGKKYDYKYSLNKK